LQDLLCDADIVGLSASLGYAPGATFTWEYVVWGILAVNGCSVSHCRGSPRMWDDLFFTLLDAGNHRTRH
ncbi:hypothetical protein N333_07917, partial [Nestor notabilis]